MAVVTHSVWAQQGGYATPPTTKTYTKLRNPLIKKNVAVSVLVLNGKAYLDGDIYLGQVSDLDLYERSIQVQSVTADDRRWSRGIVPFTFLDGFTLAERQLIVNAMNDIATRTNVCFRHRTSEADHIRFRRMTVAELGFLGGQSELGRAGGAQEIQLSQVNQSTVIHEIGHALGLHHEQSREDRNSHVEIIGENIEFPALLDFPC